MGVTDPIADMLTRIRNAILVEKETVEVPASKVKTEIAKILVDEGFLASYEVLDEDTKAACIKIRLYYKDKGDAAIAGLKRVSKPGLRVYRKKGEIPRVFGGLGISVISTSQGVMTGHVARSKGLGGELLFLVW
jgi:small subunit ribosomal protein S8